jgi:diguanylate cyclase (GGDEF)-like protein/PAS domain S-box-containing protein
MLSRRPRVVARLDLLVVEDSLPDFELVVRTLKRSAVECACRRVESETQFREALQRTSPDLILADYTLPNFSGIQALDIARSLRPDAPFIFVSGTMGEEHVLEALQSGAADYVLKNDLARLPSAIERAINESRARVEQQEMQQALRHSELRFRLAASTGNVWDWTPATGQAHISAQWKERLGYGDHEVPNTAQAWLALLEPTDLKAVLQAFRAHVIERLPFDIEYRARSSSGEYLWSHAKGQAVWDESGRATYMAGTVMDITKRKLAELKVKRLNRVYAVLSGINSLLIRVQNRAELFQETCRIAVDEGEFRLAWIGLVDRAAQRIVLNAWSGAGNDYVQHIPLSLDRASGQWGLVGEAVEERRAIIVQRVQDDPRIVLRDQALMRGLHSFAVLPLAVGDESVGALLLYAPESDFFDAPEMKLLRELASDIAFALDHLRKAEQLHYLAYYDALTGLANRHFVQNQLDELLHAHRAAEGGQPGLALVIINIDRFKGINDTLGWPAGDLLLKAFAQRLQSLADIARGLGRVGGDEFALILHFNNDASEIPGILISQVFAALRQPFEIEQQPIYLTFRTGVAVYPGDGMDAVALFSAAEIASRTAAQTEERYQFYSSKMNDQAAARLRLEQRLRQAIANREFVLHYQPKVSLRTGMVCGVEALLRWNEPGVGLVSPASFIPVLEDTGMILDVGRWAIAQALADSAPWRGPDGERLRVAVNVSAAQMRRSDFLDELKALLPPPLGKTGLDIELTESLLIDNIEATIGKLKQMQELGIGLAVDDFGTGYSSLSYLKRLPIDCLKIDQTFVRDVTTDPDAAAICVAIIDLAHNLKLKVVAEGVETQGQLRYLRRRGCDEMQGYLFSAAVPAEEIGRMLQKRTTLDLSAVSAKDRQRILIVDDEANILSAIKRSLRSEGYEIFTTTSAREGLEILACQEIQVILSDQRMPEMNGTEFLSRARDLYPRTIRIILSGYTDLESISGAINRGAIYKFLTKPWDDDDLRSNVREAFRQYGPPAFSAS